MCKKTVITYGTFDLIHYGHLNLLKNASRLGDKLIVGVSTDEFCLKKNKKTVFDLNKRMGYIQDLKYVDLVIPEHSMQQKVLDIDKYNVDVFCLGDDYADAFKNMPEYAQLLEKGVEIVFLPRTPGISSSLIKEIYNY